MKIVIQAAKPRNPYALAAKQRRGNAHGSHETARRDRRAAKRDLQRSLDTNLKKGE